MQEMIPVYRCESSFYYGGLFLVAARRLEDANDYLRAYERSNRLIDIGVFAKIKESDRVSGLYSDQEGIILLENMYRF